MSPVAPPAADDDTRPFGARFVEALHRETGSRAVLPYATIQRLKSADREATVRALRETCSSLASYELLQRLRRDQPEEVARWLTWCGRQAAFAFLLVQLTAASVWTFLAWN